jgi:hypothetical protein
MHNKILKRDNLVKRQSVDDLAYVFCNEEEPWHHLFFDCVVASKMWSEFKRVLGINFPSSTLVETSKLWNNKKPNLDQCCHFEDHLANKE